MKTLWTFGDSFTADYDTKSPEDSNVKQYLKHKGEDTLVSWPNVLSKMIGTDVKNFAKGGNSNYQIFQDFCDNSDNIVEGDIVIVCWGLLTKFRTVTRNEFINQYPSKGKFWDNVIEDRESIKWADEVYSWEKLMINYSKSKKFKLYFWCGEENNLIKDKQITTIHQLRNLGCQTMGDETNNIISDSHFGIEGHKQVANVFYNLINNE
jgi:hypothetical protein